VLTDNRFIAGTASMTIPGEELRFHDESIRITNTANEKKQSYWISQIDEGYMETYGLKLLAGRNLKESDRESGALINETAARALGFTTPEQAVNAEYLSGANKRTRIIGVVKDFHYESLRKTVEPVIFQFQHPGEFGYYTLRVKTKNTKDALAYLENIWKKHYPDDPFEYHFMDTFFAKQYEGEKLFGNLLRLFSIMSVIIAVLGIMGLSSLSIVKRTKEIGIRKVLGGSALRVSMFLSKDYIRLTLVAFTIALPLFFYLMKQWLQIFSYKIQLSWLLFVFPGIVVFGLVWLIVSLQSLRAALANPVKSLRSE
jgi:putative ABC transport system permease protein